MFLFVSRNARMLWGGNNGLSSGQWWLLLRLYYPRWRYLREDCQGVQDHRGEDRGLEHQYHGMVWVQEVAGWGPGLSQRRPAPNASCNW